MPKQLFLDTANKITVKHHAGTIYKNMKLLTRPAFFHTVAKDSMAFDHYDIVYKTPLALLKHMIPLLVSGYQQTRKNHARKKRLIEHAATWKPEQH